MVKGNSPAQEGSDLLSKNYLKKPKCPMGSADHPKSLSGETTEKGRQVRILIPQKAYPEAENTLKSHLRFKKSAQQNKFN